MPKKNLITASGTVISSVKGRVRLRITDARITGGHEVDASLSGKIAREFRQVKLERGDEVTVEISPYDLTRGRIVGRKK